MVNFQRCMNLSHCGFLSSSIVDDKLKYYFFLLYLLVLILKKPNFVKSCSGFDLFTPAQIPLSPQWHSSISPPAGRNCGKVADQGG